MTILEFLVLLVVAGICGAVGQMISGYSSGGCLASVGIGFIGALIGFWIARELRLPAIFTVRIGPTTFPIVWSILGSVLFVAVIGVFTRRRY